VDHHPKKRILFVDDEQSVLLVLQAFMQRLSDEWMPRALRAEGRAGPDVETAVPMW